MSDWNNEQFADLLQSDVETTGERHTFIIRLRAEPSSEADGGKVWRGDVKEVGNGAIYPLCSLEEINGLITNLCSDKI
jgi:hypothetical protein